MKVLIFSDYETMCRAAADMITAQIKRKPNSLICFPSGDTPLGVYKYLIADAHNGSIDFSKCYFVGLDEWVGMDKEDEGSCTHFLYHNFFTPAQIEREKMMFFNAKADDLEAACKAMDDFIKERGTLDILLVGIGMNGHIGLNEPGTDCNLYSHHSLLAKLTATVGQKYFQRQTPLHEGITLGLKYLQEAKTPILIASGAKKAEIIAQALQGEVTNGLPASIFQTLPSSYVLLDKEAATALR